QVELDLRLAEQHVAVDHRRRYLEPAALASDPHAVARLRVSGEALAVLTAQAGIARGQHAPVAAEHPHGDHALAAADILDQLVERQRGRERAAARLEQRLLGRARKVRGERAPALLHLALERAPLVARGENRESDARRDEQRDDERAELDLERSQKGATYMRWRGCHR